MFPECSMEHCLYCIFSFGWNTIFRVSLSNAGTIPSQKQSPHSGSESGARWNISRNNQTERISIWSQTARTHAMRSAWFVVIPRDSIVLSRLRIEKAKNICAIMSVTNQSVRAQSSTCSGILLEYGLYPWIINPIQNAMRVTPPMSHPYENIERKVDREKKPIFGLRGSSFMTSGSFGSIPRAIAGSESVIRLIQRSWVASRGVSHHIESAMTIVTTSQRFPVRRKIIDFLILL